jgi:hypothetical protein
MNIKIKEREVLNPLAEKDTIQIKLNPLPQKMSVIALLDNTKPNADLILNTIQENLEADNFIRINKPTGDSATSKQIKKVIKADLVILALGDCGSCTTWLILDALKLEKKGIPTISICSHVFSPFARELAESYGANSLRIMEIEHPLAGQSDESVKTKTKKIINQMNKILD